MVDKTTGFKKRAKGKKGNFKRNGKQVAAPVKKPKARPKPETECFYCKGNGHWKWSCPRYLADKKDGKLNKSIFDIHVIDVSGPDFRILIFRKMALVLTSPRITVS